MKSFVPLCFVILLLGRVHLSFANDEKKWTILITPENGVANSFELVRVLPDEVVVKKDGVQLSFPRSQIKQARSQMAEEVMNSTQKILLKIETESLSEYPEILTALEERLPDIQSINKTFDWLLPESGKIFSDLQQTISDLRNTIRASAELESKVRELEAMAVGNIPLSASWEEMVTNSLKQTEQIPYLKIRQNLVDRIVQYRRTIRLELVTRSQQSFERIQDLSRDLVQEITSEEFNQAKANLLLREMQRYLSKIGDLELRRKAELMVVNADSQVRTVLEKLQLQKMIAQFEQQLDTISESIFSPQPQDLTGLSEKVKLLESQSQNIAGHPASETAMNRLAQIQKHLTEKLAVALTPDNQHATPSPQQKSPLVDSTFTPIWMDWRVQAGSVGGIILLLVLFIFDLRRRKKHRNNQAAETFQPDSMKIPESSSSPIDSLVQDFKPADTISPIVDQDAGKQPAHSTITDTEVWGFTEEEEEENPLIFGPTSETSDIETNKKDPFGFDQTTIAKPQASNALGDDPFSEQIIPLSDDPFSDPGNDDPFGFKQDIDKS